MSSTYSDFDNTYHCYPVSSIEKFDLEKGDKVLMPASALDQLADMQITYPMLFEISNPYSDKVSHCGVLEFTAMEGMMYLPYWMMENLHLHNGDIVNVKNVSLPKGTYVKLQPHTKDFLNVSNPKAVLEATLRRYTCLTAGDTIMVSYNDKNFYINILETQPPYAVCIIETDCEVDFATPLDYKEPEKPVKPNKKPSSTKKVLQEQEESPRKVFTTVISPFTGSGQRLDGKQTKVQPSISSPALLNQHQTEDNSSNGRTNGSNQPSGSFSLDLTEKKKKREKSE